MSMNAQESMGKFREAEALYSQGRYVEALRLLDELNRAFPNDKNLLYPVALSLAGLGRRKEAMVICDQLVARFNDPRARTLKARLMGAAAQPRVAPPHVAPAGPVPTAVPGTAQYSMAGVLDNFDELLNAPSAFSVPAPQAPPPAPEWRKYLLIGGGVAGGIAILVLLGVLFGGGGGTASSSSSATGGETGLFAFLILLLVGSYLLSCQLMKMICVKAGNDPGILIWIPILQILPIWQTSGLSCMWFFVLFIPFVSIIVPVMLWMGLCQARDKSPALGLLVIVPGGVLILMLYLALSD